MAFIYFTDNKYAEERIQTQYYLLKTPKSVQSLDM